MVVGFMSLAEHAPSVKSRIRRVLRPQLTDPMKPQRSAPCTAGAGDPLRQEVLRVVGFVSLPDEHAPSVKYRVRRVLHAQRTDPMKPPRSAPPAGVAGDTG
jgi:hypothetical protein